MVKQIGLVLVAVIVGLFLLVSVGGTDQFVETILYDSNGNVLTTNPLSVVGGTEGVAFVSFRVNIENLDSIPLTFSITDLTPSEIRNAIPTTQVTIDSGQTGRIDTDLVDIQQFEGTLQDFCVTVRNEPISALRESGLKTGCVSLDIQPNPEGEFDVNVDSDLESSGTNPGCTESWTCSTWSSCVSGQETRTCTDVNSCGTTSDMPEETEICEVSQFDSNVVNSDYDNRDIWIEVNGIRYFHGGASTYNCLQENIIIETPEGFPICSRPGYSPSVRVYLDIGSRGLIFES